MIPTPIGGRSPACLPFGTGSTMAHRLVITTALLTITFLILIISIPSSTTALTIITPSSSTATLNPHLAFQVEGDADVSKWKPWRPASSSSSSSWVEVKGPVIGQTQLLWEWDFLNFTFATQDQYWSWWTNKGYEDCMLAGVKVSGEGDFYVSVPRWKANVPATLNKLVTDSLGNVLLQPYPSWQMNTPGADPLALHSVLGFEIDPQERIWILDQGKINNQPAEPGSIKLVIWDLRANKLVQSYTFPPELASPTNSFLNDIVIDQVNNFAYITDTGLPLNGTHVQGGLLVYDFANNVARRVLDEEPSVEPTSLWFEINGEPVFETKPMLAGADGIALMPDCSFIFWCPLTSRQLYLLPTALLRDASIPAAVLNESVVHFVDKGSASDGLGMSSESLLYMTALEKNGILVTDLSAHVKQLSRNDTAMIWPDTIGFDHQGNLVYVTNHLHHFMQGTMKFDQGDNNFAIWSTFINADSYLFPSNNA